MKLSEIKQSMTVALMANVVKKESTLTKDIEAQCQVVGDYMAGKFLQECMDEAEKCLKDGKKFDQLFKQFEKIGPRFSTEIEEMD